MLKQKNIRVNCNNILSQRFPKAAVTIDFVLFCHTAKHHLLCARAIRIETKRVDLLKAQKFKDSADFRTIQIVHRLKSQHLPNGIQGLFQMRENKHVLRGICMIKKS